MAVIDEVVAKISDWRGKNVSVHPLSGGLTNTNFKVEVDGEELTLTATEFRLLHYLATHGGRVQTREVLLDQVWGYSFEGYARTVDTHVRRLRKKMGSVKERIETVRGVGYRFRDVL